jgi:hypothetical protein
VDPVVRLDLRLPWVAEPLSKGPQAVPAESVVPAEPAAEAATDSHDDYFLRDDRFVVGAVTGTPADGQISANSQIVHCGLRASHTRRP